MKIQRRENDGIVFLGLAGHLEADSLKTLSEVTEPILEEGVRGVCLNFRDVAFINSTAVGYLVDFGKRLKQAGGELVFSQPSKFMADTFRTLQLNLMFELLESDREAVEYFAARGD